MSLETQRILVPVFGIIAIISIIVFIYFFLKLSKDNLSQRERSKILKYLIICGSIIAIFGFFILTMGVGPAILKG